MRNIWTIAKREYDHYFISPIAYIVAAGILLMLGGYFAAILSQANVYGYAPDVSAINGLFAFLLMLAIPALTMRLLADETRSGTIELLLTAPVRDFELVAGKWLGSFLFILTLIAITLVYPIILNNLVTPHIDQLTMLSSYLGLILVAASLLALGTGISAIFSNQVAAFFVTLVTFIVLWWLIGLPASMATSGSAFFNYLVINSHFDSTMNGGSIYLTDAVYFLSLIALGLFTGTMAIEIRRWR
jgi:ABC-2 type transport system permease protein